MEKDGLIIVAKNIVSDSDAYTRHESVLGGFFQIWSIVVIIIIVIIRIITFSVKLFPVRSVRVI